MIQLLKFEFTQKTERTLLNRYYLGCMLTLKQFCCIKHSSISANSDHVSDTFLQLHILCIEHLTLELWVAFAYNVHL
jgi:hypothetical protein